MHIVLLFHISGISKFLSFSLINGQIYFILKNDEFKFSDVPLLESHQMICFFNCQAEGDLSAEGPCEFWEVPGTFIKQARECNRPSDATHSVSR